jgi:coenzyme Q-binding protein COQ10
MRVEQQLHQLGYPQEQLYDLAADVESYPSFLRGWHSARAVSRDATSIVAEQALGIGPVTLSFRTVATLVRPTTIDITSSDRAFRRFALHWAFAPDGKGTTAVTIIADITLRSELLDRASSLALPALVAEVARAFKARAAVVCRT